MSDDEDRADRARYTHNVEQGMTTWRQMLVAAGLAYAEMVAAGVPSDVAYRLVAHTLRPGPADTPPPPLDAPPPPA